MKYLLSALLLAACAKNDAQALPGPQLPATGKPASKGDTLRVMTYNIHHCNPPTKPGFIDVDAIAKVVRDQNPDVLALQEVDVHTKRSGNIDQAALLAEKTGMYAYFAKSIDHEGGDYGVAILSKFPLTNARTIRLPETSNPAAEDRVVAIADITFRNGKKLSVGSTHLDVSTPANRDEQVAALNAIADTLALPLILSGDMNTTPQTTAFATLLEKYRPSCTDCGFTIPVNTPKRVIDFVLAAKRSGWVPVSTAVVNEPYPSDHLAVVAEWIVR